MLSQGIKCNLSHNDSKRSRYSLRHQNKDRGSILKQPLKVLRTKLFKLFYFYPASYMTTTGKGDPGGWSQQSLHGKRYISLLRSSFGHVLPFLSASGMIWKMGVRKQLISTSVTHPPQRSPMLRGCFILPVERNRVSLCLTLGVLLLAGTRFTSHRPNHTVHFSYTQSGICKNTKGIQ